MSEEIRHLPIEALRECPTNPRTSYNQAKLEELANSIKANGVMQPIVVRSLYADEPGGPPADAVERYEVIFGHRRLRACRLAQLDAAPCIVRQLADDQVAVAQLVENAQREDVTALDEAESFRRLIDEHKVKVAEIIKQTGKSKSYVYARLKLLHLDSTVKAALLDGTIDAEVAVLISRLPQSVQAEALDDVTLTDGDDKPEGMSYRRAKVALQNYLVDLDEAAFALDADDLSKTAPACTKCQRRSGNTPDLQAELGDNICTGRECFHAKSVVFAQRRINAAKQAGQQVIEGDEARRVQYYPGSWMSGYRELDGDTTLPNGATIKVRDLVEQCGAQAPAPALLSHPVEPTKLVEVISTAAIERMCKIAAGIDPDAAAPELPLVGGQGASDDGAADDDAPQWAAKSAEAQAVLNQESWGRARDAICQRVRTTRRTASDLRLIVRRELDLANEFPDVVYAAFGWTDALSQADDEEEFLRAKVDEASPDDLAAILTLIAIGNMDEMYISATRADAIAATRLAVAQAYGVNPRAPTDAPVGAGANGAPTPSPGCAAEGEGASGASAETKPKPVKSKPADKGKKQKVDAGVAAGGSDANGGDLVDAMEA